MALIHLETKLHDIVMTDPTVVTVLNRFGIELGVGDNTVGSICLKHGMNSDFFMTILNTYLSSEYFPEKVLSSFSANLIVDYLNKTNSYYEQFQIPNIERHFSFLLQKSDAQNSNLALMMQFFVEVKAELLQRISDDRLRWFPEVLELDTKHSTKDLHIVHFEEENDSIEDKIDDLISMFVIHLKGKYDHNLCQAVLIALTSLKKDITQNNRIRNRILKPLSQALLNC